MKKGHLIIFIILAGGIVFYFLDPARYLFIPKCPFKLLTGLSCPGCGFQRALHAFLHGHFAEAIGYNWFLIASLPYAIALILTNFFLPHDIGWKWNKILEHRYVIYTYIALFFIWWITRNILGI